MFVDRGEAIVVGLKFGVTSHFLFVTVVELRDDLESLLRFQAHHLLARRDGDRTHFRSGRLTVRQPGGNPVGQRAVFVGGLLDADSATVRHVTAGFLQEQTFLGHHRIRAAAAAFAGQSRAIGRGIEAEDRELESVLPFGLAVTAGGVATEAAEDRQHIGLKVKRAKLCRLSGMYRLGKPQTK